MKLCRRILTVMAIVFAAATVACSNKEAKRTSTPTPSPAIEARWVCQECGRANDDEVCTNCGAPKPPRATLTPTPTPTIGVRWMCQECGRANDGDVCTNCGAQKPPKRTPVPVWVCPFCNQETDGEQYCLYCGAERTPYYGTMEQLSANRELQAFLHPKTELLPLGTMPDMGEFGRMVREYALEVEYHYEEITKSDVYLDKIMPRLQELERAMGNRQYLPSVGGILSVIKEKGVPNVESSWGISYNSNGIASYTVWGTWEWVETRQFASEEEGRAYVESPWIADPKAEVSWEADDWDTITFTIKYRITDTVGVTFNLVTGEELELGDLFPKGFDYISYLNGKIAEKMQYQFRFSDYEYRQNGKVVPLRNERYIEAAEYDGGVAFAGLTGEEPFYFEYDGTLCFPGLWAGGVIAVELPEPVCYISGEENLPFSVATYTCNPLYGIDLSEYDTNGARSEVPLGEVKLSQHGETGNVTVWRGSYTEEMGAFGGVQREKEPFEKLFTDEALVNYAKQWIDKQWKKESDQYGNDYTLRNITFIRAWVYPGGYTQVLLQHNDGQDAAYGMQESTFWVKDGKIIPWEELFDVSAEELVLELLLNLRYGNRNGAEALDKEKAATAAKVLVKYVQFSPRYCFETMYGWSLDDYGSALPVEYRLCDRTDKTVPQEDRAQIPATLYEQGGFSLSDPNVLLRHLRMYKGFPFE
ncbi:MAG: hypothetical protein J5628_06170 [Lachnospiraceae bacterium]|nr:hypothetical protein [Lachnospiraceae bacterium]